MADFVHGDFTISVQMKCQEFAMPPIRDALILGKDSPIGCEALRKAIHILQPQEFEHIELGPDDDVLSDILVRSSVLKKIPKDKLVEIILRRFKPLMDSHECLHLNISAELSTEDVI